MKLALHRSLTFWAGLFVMAFIGCAWRDSMTHFTTARYGHCSAMQAVGGICLGFHEDWRIAKPIWREKVKGFSSVDVGEYGIAITTTHADTRPSSPWPDLIIHTATKDRAIFTPHYLLLLAVAIPWTILLLWRARRRRKACPVTEGPSEGQPELA